VEQWEAEEFTRIREEKLSIAFVNEFSKVVPPSGVLNRVRFWKVQIVPKAARDLLKARTNWSVHQGELHI